MKIEIYMCYPSYGWFQSVLSLEYITHLYIKILTPLLRMLYILIIIKLLYIIFVYIYIFVAVAYASTPHHSLHVVAVESFQPTGNSLAAAWPTHPDARMHLLDLCADIRQKTLEINLSTYMLFTAHCHICFKHT